MTISVNDLFLLTADGRCFDQRVMLTLGYRVEATPADVTENAASLGLIVQAEGGVGGGDKIETAYLACLPPQYTLLRWRAQKVYPVRYRTYDGARSVPGTHAENTETTNLAGCITMQTRIAGRGEQGVKHIGPLPYGVTSIDNGTLQPAYKTLLSALGVKLYTDILIPVLGVNFRPVIIHRQLDEAGHVVSMSSTDIFTASVGEVVGTMSRRTVGRGQ